MHTDINVVTQSRKVEFGERQVRERRGRKEKNQSLQQERVTGRGRVAAVGSGGCDEPSVTGPYFSNVRRNESSVVLNDSPPINSLRRSDSTDMTDLACLLDNKYSSLLSVTTDSPDTLSDPQNVCEVPHD